MCSRFVARESGENMKKHVISNAYDAYWFLSEHPKFSVPERMEVTPEQCEDFEKRGYLVSRDIGGKCYRYFRHSRRCAIDTNLDIHYTKVNKPRGGRVDKDRSKNKYVECWLEFGPLSYGYSYSCGDEPAGDWDTETQLLQSHDCTLDTGGQTFDVGLIRLALLVRKHYGDFDAKWVEEGRKRWCGKPVCPDCAERRLNHREIPTTTAN